MYIGPYASGVEASSKHTWSVEGDYEIKAKVKYLHGAESGWETLTVSMPKSNQYTFVFTEILSAFSFL